MRILYVINGLGEGGAERLVELLAIGCRDGGDRVAVLAVTRGGAVATRLERAGIAVHVLGLRSAIEPEGALALAAAIRDLSPDLVHSHLAVSDVASWAAGGVARVTDRLAAVSPAPSDSETGVTRQLRRPRRIATVHNPGVGADPRITWI